MIDRYTLPEMGAIWTDRPSCRPGSRSSSRRCAPGTGSARSPTTPWPRSRPGPASTPPAWPRSRRPQPRRDRLSDRRRRARRRRLEVHPLRHDELPTCSTPVCALQIKRAGELLQRDLAALGEVLKRRAFEFRDTVQVGPHPRRPRRAHHLRHEARACWAFEVARHLDRLRRVTDGAAVGKLSGAVGATTTSTRGSRSCLRRARLGRSRSPTRSCSATATPPSCGAGHRRRSLEKFAVEVRHLQRTEVREAEEFFGEGQKGSSAMPHKRNPITSERMAGWRGCCAATRRRQWRTWRSGTSATSRTARRSASFPGFDASCSTTCCRSRRSCSTRWSSTRRGCWPTSRVAAPRLQRRRAARARRPRHAARRRLPGGAGHGHAGLARGRRLRRPHQGRPRGAALRPPRSTRPWTPTSTGPAARSSSGASSSSRSERPRRPAGAAAALAAVGSQPYVPTTLQEGRLALAADVVCGVTRATRHVPRPENPKEWAP